MSEMMGSVVHLHVSVMGKDAVVIVPTIDLPASDKTGASLMGKDVSFTFSGDVVHVFSKDSNKNLEF